MAVALGPLLLKGLTVGAGVAAKAAIAAVVFKAVAAALDKVGGKPSREVDRDGTTQVDGNGRYIRTDPNVLAVLEDMRKTQKGSALLSLQALQILSSIDKHMRVGEDMNKGALEQASALFPALEKILVEAGVKELPPPKAPGKGH